MFSNGEIDYIEWCELVSAKLKKYGYSHEDLIQVANQTKILPDVENVFKKLKFYGYRIEIISGGITEVIQKSLGDAVKYVDRINANKLLFGVDGKLQQIIATEYDYKGKAVCIEKSLRETGTLPQNAIFVGNSANDEWVWRTGVKTICINPEGANYKNKQLWTEYYLNVTTLETIYPSLVDGGKPFDEIKKPAVIEKKSHFVQQPEKAQERQAKLFEY